MQPHNRLLVWNRTGEHHRFVIRKTYITNFKIVNSDTTRSSVRPSKCVGPVTTWIKSKESIRLINSLASGFISQQTWILKSQTIKSLSNCIANSFVKSLFGFGGRYSTEIAKFLSLFGWNNSTSNLEKISHFKVKQLLQFFKLLTQSVTQFRDPQLVK